MMLTELLPANNLDNSGTIRIYHVVKALYMQETILPLKTSLQRRELRRNLHQVVVDDGDLSKGSYALSGGGILC